MRSHAVCNPGWTDAARVALSECHRLQTSRVFLVVQTASQPKDSTHRAGDMHTLPLPKQTAGVAMGSRRNSHKHNSLSLSLTMLLYPPGCRWQ